MLNAIASVLRPPGIEKCLITARRLGGHDERIVPMLWECALEPFFLGHIENLPLLGYLAELLEVFGWDQAEELVCNLAAKILGRDRVAIDRIITTMVLLAAGMSYEEILRDYPELTEDDIRACLAYAADRERRLLTTA